MGNECSGSGSQGKTLAQVNEERAARGEAPITVGAIHAWIGDIASDPREPRLSTTEARDAVFAFFASVHGVNLGAEGIDG